MKGSDDRSEISLIDLCDDEGFLLDPNTWTRRIALQLAAMNGLADLDREHWRIIDYLREYYREYQVAPHVNTLTRSCAIDLRDIFRLFPEGPTKGAIRIAGLPKPKNCS